MDRGAFILWALGLCACGPAANVYAPAAGAPPAPVASPGPRAVLPADAAPFAPAQVRLTGHGELRGEQLADIDACEGCHADVSDQLQTSAHAFSSFNNPLYRFGVDGFRERVGREQSQMCGGCHDMALLVDGAMLDEVRADDSRAHAGITCRVCHGIESARPDGNGSYTLSRATLPIPKRGQPDTVASHVAAVQPLDDDVLCGSCHRSFLSEASGNDHFLAGMDDFGAWRGSAYNGNGAGRVDDPVQRASCRDCHMAREPAEFGDAAAGEDGKISSHRFLGGHTWLAAMRGDDAQLEKLRDFLRGTVSVDLAAARSGQRDWHRPAQGTPVAAGEELLLDVVVRNVGVGHAFPGGVRDAVDSWLSLEVRDVEGQLLGGTRDDDTAHRFRVLLGDRHGEPQLMRNTEDFYEAIVDHTLAARDARVIRYSFRIPEDLAPERLPLQLRATLLHRSRNLEFQDGACDASRSERGQAFARAQRDQIGSALDPCTPQPVSTVGEARAWVGPGALARARHGAQDAQAPSPPPLARRLYEHGLGLLAELPREAGRARASLLSALALVDAEAGGHATDLRRAQITSALGAVYAGAPCGPSAPAGWPTCAGRLQEALRWLDQAEAAAPGHPAIANIRARAYQRRSHWPQAAASLQAVAAAVPQNVGVARALGKALSGLGRHGQALQVARHGLGLSPRDDDLLRVQVRALTELGAEPGEVGAAQDAYLDHRRADRPTAMRALCMADDPRCQQERRAVHTHAVPPAGASHARQAEESVAMRREGGK